jgi:hypothetical protein
MSQSTAENFFALWDTYEKVVASNYMFHREIAEEITRALSVHIGSYATGAVHFDVAVRVSARA